MSETFTLKMKDENGDSREVELDAAQVLDLGAGKAIAYFPHDERVYIDEDGTITERESAIPPPDYPDAA